MTAMYAHNPTHVLVGFANPFLICEECKEKVSYWHNPERCGSNCTEAYYNSPCGHKADVNSICFSWSPVDGCQCINQETHDSE